MALGIDSATPRDGTRRNPFQQDSTRFKGAAADTTWSDIKVTDMPPGDNSRSRDTQTSDQALTAAIPVNQACSGTVAGQENVCLVRCMNDANAGPFGGVVPVQMVSSHAGGRQSPGEAQLR
ncbi:hypothetical protein diail_7911 [Diaporthe ilicicola]|nr:hypothetical protein diail_7911 [Diaporthe ilicicola]